MTDKGCIKQKHEFTKDDDEEELRNIDIEAPYMKNTKCKCCKKFGHYAQDCPLDPNIKTREDASLDMDRIIHIKDSAINDHFADG